MKKNRKFLLGALIVLVLVGYLVKTGMAESQQFFYTPTELAAKVASDPAVHDQTVRVGGHIVPGSSDWTQEDLNLRFEVVDIEGGDTRFAVNYNGLLPETFAEDQDVVVVGKMTPAGVFEATEVITKCGSRYEAQEEDFVS